MQPADERFFCDAAKVRPRCEVSRWGAGGGLFWGGEAAEAFMPVEADGSWIYLGLVWKK